MDNFDKIISLGYNCFPCMYKNHKFGKNTQESLFDDVATPAWAIRELLANDFEGLFDVKNFTLMPLFTNSNKKFMTNIKYYIRFTDKYPITGIKSVVEILKKKKDMFMNYLDSNEKILFIRYEESTVNEFPYLGDEKIMYPLYKSYYDHDELYHLRQLSSYLQIVYPKLDFHIMFIGSAQNTNINTVYDSNTKIFTFPCNQTLNINNYISCIDDIFVTNETFISNSIKNSIKLSNEPNTFESIGETGPSESIGK